MEKSKPAGAGGQGLGQVVAFALLVSLLSGLLLWYFQPKQAGKVVPLLIRSASGQYGERFIVMNGGKGNYTVELYGGEVADGGAQHDMPSTHLQWAHSGQISAISLDTILKEGKWVLPTGAYPLLHPGDVHLPAGHYVIEITGSDHTGSIYAGAQAFEIASSTPAHPAP